MNLVISKKSIRGLLACIVFVVNTGYALTTGSPMLCIFVMLAYWFADFLMEPVFTIKNNGPQVFLIFHLVTLAFAFLANFDLSVWKEYLRIILLLFTAWRIFSSFSKEELIRGFMKLMRITVVVSLIYFLLVQTLPSSLLLEVSNGYGVKYYTCFFASVISGTGFLRNSGLFWEAGMFAAITAIWSMFEIIYTKNKQKKLFWFLISVVSILTTSSTSGYIYLVFLIVLYFTSGGEKLNLRQIITLLMVGVAVVAVVVNYDAIVSILVEWNPEVFMKLQLENASVTDRFYGPIADLYIGLRNPFGVGIGENFTQVQAIVRDMFDIFISSRTSSITYYFSALGIGGLVILLPFCKLLKAFTNNFVMNVIIFVLFVWITFSTPLNDTILLYLLLFIGADSFGKREVPTLQIERD